jgi:DNA-binding transcriptional MerR regulator
MPGSGAPAHGTRGGTAWGGRAYSRRPVRRAIKGAAPVVRHSGARQGQYEPDAPLPAGDTWMLQSQAAATAGCSVSAIRKWRRVGLVADRTRISPGGMRRVEVRLEDVLARMRMSMPRQSQPQPLPARDPQSPAVDVAQAAMAVVPANDLDIFVQHIAEAERRAAQAEARAQAKDAMIQFLREQVADLEAQLQRSASDAEAIGATQDRTGGGPHIRRLITQMRDLRARSRTNRQDLEHRAAVRLSYDAALICLCTIVGIETSFVLGDALTTRDRTKLAQALAAAGFDVVG